VAPEYSLLSDDKGYEFFKQIPQPTSIDDWLAQYVDNGQTFQQYVSRCPWLFSQKLDGIEQTFIHTGGNLCEKYPSLLILLHKEHHLEYLIEVWITNLKCSIDNGCAGYKIFPLIHDEIENYQNHLSRDYLTVC
jgi:hypothetical protein